MKTIVLFFSLAIPALAQLPTGVYPLLNCVSYNPSTLTVTAFFGYVSANTDGVVIPVGLSNETIPGQVDRGQPDVFFTGLNNQVWHTSFITTEFPDGIVWTLLGNPVTATNNPANYCGNSDVACWDTNGNGQCDLSEDINGDGMCNALDCQGRTGATGAVGQTGPQGQQGSAGPAGPPGISPAISTVTVSSGSTSATAACSAGQVLLNGGGTCTVTNSASGGLQSSAPSGSSGWTVSCIAGNATAVALCALQQ